MGAEFAARACWLLPSLFVSPVPPSVRWSFSPMLTARRLYVDLPRGGLGWWRSPLPCDSRSDWRRNRRAWLAFVSSLASTASLHDETVSAGSLGVACVDACRYCETCPGSGGFVSEWGDWRALYGTLEDPTAEPAVTPVKPGGAANEPRHAQTCHSACPWRRALPCSVRARGSPANGSHSGVRRCSKLYSRSSRLPVTKSVRR